MASSDTHNKDKEEEQQQEDEQATVEENLRLFLEDAHFKSQAYRKILNSLNINKNKD